MSILTRGASYGFTKFAGSLPTPRLRQSKATGELLSEFDDLLPEAPTYINGIEASLADRWTILGMTGTGKTTFAKRLITTLKDAYPGAHVYILDTKPMHRDFQDIQGYRIESDEAPDALKSPGAVQVWCPNVDDVKQFDTWFRRIAHNEKPAIVLVDELANLTGFTGRVFPQGYALLMKQGRGIDMSIISLTQEAAYVPRQVFSQPTHVLQFRVLNEFDRRLGAKLLGRSKDEYHVQPSAKHGFFYRKVDSDSPTTHEYSSYEEFFGSRFS